MKAASSSIHGGNATYKESLKSGIIPKVSSLSCSSIFSKYIFPLQKYETSNLVDMSLELFQSLNPFSPKLEQYLSIALLSSEDGMNHRDPLNLILVIDVSGSMNSKLYHNSKNDKPEIYNKLDLAKSCIKGIYSKLNDDERLGVLTFNGNHNVILELQDKASIKKKDFFTKVENLYAGGGTSIEAGYKPAVVMMKDFLSNSHEKIIDIDSKKKPINNRIIFITDAIISNQQEKDLLYEINAANAAHPLNIFTSFIGVGIDFNTDLISRLTKVRGSNYFAVHSEEEFTKILLNDFNYIVTPLCFDVYAKLEGNGYEIEKTYGSPFDYDGEENIDALNEMKKGGLLRIETLSAYEKCLNGLKGGVILIKLKQKLVENDENRQDLDLRVSLEYEDFHAKKICLKKEIDFKSFKETASEFYFSEGVRKAMLLARYVEFTKHLLTAKEKVEVETFLIYFEKEMKELHDNLLEEEYQSLKSVIKLKK